jgi:mannosyltransferase
MLDPPVNHRLKVLSPAHLVVLLLALAVGAALRVDRLGREELTTDEAFSWRMSTYPAAEIVARTAADVHPPLYYLALRGWTGVWGDSPVALRSLSTVFGLAAVLLAYLVCVETGRVGARIGGTREAGAAVAAVLVAVHADQVSHSRHARMYAMGAFLAGVSAWLLLRALRSETRALRWWAAYAFAAAALFYTHYYGAFTVAAQLLFAAVVVAARWRSAPEGRSAARGWLGAVLMAGALVVPWIPVARRQAARVSAQYWIGEPGLGDIAAALVRWAVGVDSWPPFPVVVIAVFAAVLLWAIVRGDGGLRFLGLQAAVPWLGALALSLLARRPLFLERYLFFSQLALLAGLGHLALLRSGPWPKRVVAAGLGSLLGLGLAQEAGGRPTREAAAEEAARFLARSVPPRDLVLANAPRDLMLIGYYLRRAGATGLELKCPASRSEGHLSQVAAIRRDEVLPDEDVWADHSRKVWLVRLHPPRRWRPEPPPVPWTLTFSRWFEGPGGTRVLVMVYDPRSPES